MYIFKSVVYFFKWYWWKKRNAYKSEFTLASWNEEEKISVVGSESKIPVNTGLSDNFVLMSWMFVFWTRAYHQFTTLPITSPELNQSDLNRILSCENNSSSRIKS